MLPKSRNTMSVCFLFVFLFFYDNLYYNYDGGDNMHTVVSVFLSGENLSCPGLNVTAVIRRFM